ncbi:MAG: hypothetical protein IPK66_17385 [Rhodospirillales bacterium]|nr:hypothetical protein [Rhodospirillales bacterium]
MLTFQRHFRAPLRRFFVSVRRKLAVRKDDIQALAKPDCLEGRAVR